MKTQPILPAVVTGHPDGRAGLPYSPQYGDVYHAEAGALEQARAVFLAGNHLPQRWAKRERFVILETGFGLGNNFLATWDAWRQDERRCERLVFISIEKHPLRQPDLARHLAGSPLPELARQLVAAWPALTPNIHSLVFEAGRVQLLLALGDVADVLPAILAQVDAFYLDGFAPDRNPEMWNADILRRMERLAVPGASAATWSAARALRDGLDAAGFLAEKAPGFAGKRDMTRARFIPKHIPVKPPGGLLQPQLNGDARQALIIGGGLAGCAAAWALAEQGWHSTVLDQCAQPAQAGSGNPAGLFHGIVNAEDSRHARAHRAAALATAAVLRPWLEQGRVAGQCAGLLRLEPRAATADAQALLLRLGLPERYLKWLDQAQAQQATGLPVSCGGWWFSEGGWVSPRDYAQALLDTSGAQFIGGVRVAALRKLEGLWQALDEQGKVLAQAPVAVIAAATDSPALLASTSATHDAHIAANAAPPSWLPLTPVRGQISQLPDDQPGLIDPLAPVAGAGYVLPAHQGQVTFGATSQHDDADPNTREADHLHNLAQAAKLGMLQATAAEPPADALEQALRATQGRVGWRAVTPDRLPLIGALPDPQVLGADAGRARLDQPRLIPRQRDAQGGLYMLTGLGSRGITWAALGGRLLASWVTGCPCPVEADLRDALDVARFVARQMRAGTGATGAE